MTKVQLDKWFALSDRVDKLIARKKITPSDASTLLTPVRQIEDHNVERELDVAELSISKTEKAGFLPGSQESLSASQAEERSNLFFASRPKQ